MRDLTARHALITAAFAVAVIVDLFMPKFAAPVSLAVNMLWLWED